jgi:hypothetical protein
MGRAEEKEKMQKTLPKLIRLYWKALLSRL